MASSKIWMDGDLLDSHLASASPLAHGLHYGTGVFEGIRSYATDDGARVFRLREHLARMKKGADVLGLPFDEETFYRGTLDTLRANELHDAYVRPLQYFESGGLGLDVAPLRPRGFIATLPWKSHLGEQAYTVGVSLRTSSWRRNPSTSLPPLKLCGNYVNSILAKREATEHGAMEALFVDDHGFVVEATGENVFLVKRGRVTAVQHKDALPGITRDSVMQLSNADQRPVTLEELRDADEIFLTGTSAEVAAVSRFDGRDLVPGPVTRELGSLYQAVVHGRAERQRGWLHG